MASSNPVREALSSGRFSYFVELVASAKTTEEKLQEMAAELAAVPGLIAAGVTSWAGGSAGHDPIRVGELTRAQGLTPNVHLTCVNHSRQELIDSLLKLNGMGIDNVFAITGDYPLGDRTHAEQTHDPSAVDYDIDSVQLVELIQEMRQQGLPFHVSVAVSPFKYTEADCVYQYLKLEKKIAAGADFAITQLGYDVKKFRELKRYLEERGLKTPVFGNVYVLSAGAAKKFAKAEPPGCWVSPELLAKVTEEATAPDKGLAARLERAAKTVAALRGLGFAGAYIGGTHSAEHIRKIIQRSEETRRKLGRIRRRNHLRQEGRILLFRIAAHRSQEARVCPEADGCDRAGQHAEAAAVGVERTAGLGGSSPLRGACAGAGRIRVQSVGVRLPGLRQLRAGRDGIRLPHDVPQESAQRPLRRHRQRPVRGVSGPRLHLGEGV